MNVINKFEINSRVISGIDSMFELIDILDEKFKFQNIGIVVDNNLYIKSVNVQKLIDLINKKFKKCIILKYKLKHEPTYDYLDKVKIKFKKNNKSLVDCIVGIGGGSSIDLAKGIATLIKNHKPALKYRGFPTNLNKSIPVIALPTTAGTGTELAFNAVFIDKKNNIKLGINSKNNYPVLSILDPKLISASPNTVIINSALGALIRSVETFVSPHANFISKKFSKMSFELIYQNLPKVLKNKKDYKSILKLQWAAYFSMAALSNSSSGPAGALSYFFSLNFQIPQGLGYSVAGIKIINLNHKLGYYGYSELTDLVNDSLQKKITKRKKSELFIKNINNFFIKYNMYNFPKIAISKNNYDKLHIFYDNAKLAFKNNPIVYDKNNLTILTSKLFNK